jgi:hypothetical protein
MDHPCLLVIKRFMGVIVVFIQFTVLGQNAGVNTAGTELTEGKQTPTSRVENAYNDFKIR